MSQYDFAAPGLPLNRIIFEAGQVRQKYLILGKVPFSTKTRHKLGRNRGYSALRDFKRLCIVLYKQLPSFFAILKGIAGFMVL